MVPNVTELDKVAPDVLFYETKLLLNLQNKLKRKYHIPPLND